MLEFFLSCESLMIFFFFFKQKTAYDMRISDWSSDVCSSDLGIVRMVRQFHSSRSAYQVSPLVGIDDALSGRQKHSCGNQPMRPAKYLRVHHLRRVSIVDVVTDDDATDWDVFLQGPGNTDTALRVESDAILIHLPDEQSCAAVPLGRHS